VLLREPRNEFLAVRILAQEQDSGFAESPFEMGIADLSAAMAEDFSGRAFLGLDESRVGEELLDPGEAIDVLDLVEQDKGEDAADAGDRAQQVIAEGVVALAMRASSCSRLLSRPS
jgi:hypothetical protein